jgi:hypothetical protein
MPSPNPKKHIKYQKYSKMLDKTNNMENKKKKPPTVIKIATTLISMKNSITRVSIASLP